MNTWKNHAHQLKTMFHTYHYPDDLADYKSIFYQEGYPTGIDSIYPGWRPKMNSVRIEPQAVFYGLLDQQEVACIQYSATGGDDIIQMGFFARRIEGRWYPLGSKLNPQYQHVMALMAILEVDVVQNWIQPGTNPVTMEAASRIWQRCGGDEKKIYEPCLYAIGEEWGISNQPDQLEMEALVFKPRFTEGINRRSPPGYQQNLVSYLTELELDEKAQHTVLYYLRKNEMMKALAVMGRHGVTRDWKIIMRDLNSMQGVDRYKTIEQKPAEPAKTE